MIMSSASQLNQRPLKLLQALCNRVSLDSLRPIPGAQKVLLHNGQQGAADSEHYWVSDSEFELPCENDDDKKTVLQFENCVANINRSGGAKDLEESTESFINTISAYFKKGKVQFKHHQADTKFSEDKFRKEVDNYIGSIAPRSDDEHILAYKELALVLELQCRKTRKAFKLIAIPAQVDALKRIDNIDRSISYRLRPLIHYSPIINPAILSDTEKAGTELVLGTVENYKRALQHHAPPNTDDWEIWYRYATRLLADTTGKTWQQILEYTCQQPAYIRGEWVINSYLSPWQMDDNATREIKSLYAFLFKNIEQIGTDCSLHQALTAHDYGFNGQRKPADFLTEALEKSGDYLLGHMDESGKEVTFSDLRDRELFPLDNTQRQVTQLISETKPGDIIAVNGPPGSGKTAMLKAVIAHQWVEAALEKKDCPITIAVGATNQSVTNVIEAFPEVLFKHQAMSEEQLITRRWLTDNAVLDKDNPAPGSSYGTYFPSTTQLNVMNKEQKKKYMIGKVSGSNALSVFEWQGEDNLLSDSTKIEQLKQTYLVNAHKYFEELIPPLNIDDVVNSLHSLLQKKRKAIKALHQQFHKKPATDFKQRFLTEFAIDEGSHSYNLRPQAYYYEVKEEGGVQQIKESGVVQEIHILLCGTEDQKLQIIKEVLREKIRDEKINITDEIAALEKDAIIILFDRLLDVTHRADMFHIAARYWEGIYLKSSLDTLLVARTEQNVIEGLRRLCMLTPCLVSTVNSVAKLFKLENHSRHHDIYALNAADLLVMDESGQAQQRLALPLLGLAKRVVAVGDVMQLQPVIPDTEISVMDEYIEYLHAGYTEHEYLTSIERNITTIGGSMLHLMRHAARFALDEPGKPDSEQSLGLLLRGHYRCQSNIIQFCNELVYDNKLFFHPKDTAERSCFRSFCWVNSSSPTIRVGSSHTNKQEAQKIASFIFANWLKIREHRNKKGEFPYREKSIDNIIALVTPFNAQAPVLREALKEEFDKKLQSAPDYVNGIESEHLDKIVIGTVDSLQGAEKPIVIFSGVKGKQNSGELHFEATPFLLNVAVSRAQDCFIAFICEEQYKVNETYSDESQIEALRENSAHYLGYYLGTATTKEQKCGELKTVQRCERLLPKKLVVIEAGGKLKPLTTLLDCEYQVIATGGSITQVGLDDDSLSAKTLKPKYGLTDNGAEVIDRILSTADSFDEVILATDDDYVGEAIAWHLSRQLIQKNPSIKDKLYRINLGALTQEKVDEAFKAKSQSINKNIVAAEVLREIADNLIARKLMHALDKLKDDFSLGNPCFVKYAEAIQLLISEQLVLNSNNDLEPGGMGRVQVGILDLLYEHARRQIATSQDEVKHQTLPVTLQLRNGIQLSGKVYGMPEDKLIKRRQEIFEKDDCQIIADLEENWEQQKNIDSPPHNEKSTLSLTKTSTAELLALAWEEERLKPDEVMSALQTLYEGNY